MSTFAGSDSEENLRIGSETDSEETDEEEFQEWFRRGVENSGKSKKTLKFKNPKKVLFN